jgi:hypothetical protein
MEYQLKEDSDHTIWSREVQELLRRTIGQLHLWPIKPRRIPSERSFNPSKHYPTLHTLRRLSFLAVKFKVTVGPSHWPNHSIDRLSPLASVADGQHSDEDKDVNMKRESKYQSWYSIQSTV